MKLTEALILAQRGRDSPGGYEQRLEIGGSMANTLTSVQKDNYLIEVYECESDADRLPEEGKRIRREIGDNGGITFANRKWTPRSDGISNTLTKVEKDNLLIEPLRVRQATKEGYIEVLPGGVVDLSYPTSATRRGRVQEGGLVTPTLTRNTENSIYRYEGIMETKDKKGYGTFKDENTGKTYIYRIRKLTPRECFRLMGVSETNIDNIQNAGISRTQQYKMAGNSIVTDVLYHIFRNLFCEHEKTTLF